MLLVVVVVGAAAGIGAEEMTLAEEVITGAPTPTVDGPVVAVLTIKSP